MPWCLSLLALPRPLAEDGLLPRVFADGFIQGRRALGLGARLARGRGPCASA